MSSTLNCKGVVLSSIDIKEKDKLVTIFTLEKGIMSAKLIGAKNANAKLKSVKEPFCFADFIFNINGNSITITSANIIDSFYDITSDLDNFYTACEIINLIKKTLPADQSNVDLFIGLLKSFNCLAYEKINPNYALIKFYLRLFTQMGYRFSLEKCSVCGGDFIIKRYINFAHGEIVCADCRMPNMKEISSLAHATMRIISKTDFENLRSLKLKEDGIVEAVNILRENLSYRLN